MLCSKHTVRSSLVPDVLGHARSLPVNCYLSGRGSKSVFGPVAQCALEPQCGFRFGKSSNSGMDLEPRLGAEHDNIGQH